MQRGQLALPQIAQSTELVDARPHGRELGIARTPCHRQPLLFDLRPCLELLGARARYLECQRRGQAVPGKIGVHVGPQLRLCEVGLHLCRFSLLIQQLALQLHLPAREVRDGRLQLQLCVTRSLLHLGIGQLGDDCVGLDRRPGMDKDTIDTSVSRSRDQPDVLRHQGARAANLPQHLPALNGVDDDGRPLDLGGGRLQPRHPVGHTGEGDNDEDGDDQPPPLPCHGQFGSEDVH